MIIHEHFIEPGSKGRGNQRDYNKMVSLLNDEAQREAHNNYLSKMKKKAE